jgi:ribosome-associated protein
LNSLEKSETCVRLALENKAIDPVVLELIGTTALADYFLVCSGTSERHTQAMAEHIELSLKQIGIMPRGVEGRTKGKWILMDYGDVIIHIFQESERAFYDLEALWADCPRIPISDAP